MKTAAIYARYSSHKQREESIEEQVDECREYAFQNDMNVVEVYSDSAISGKTENRDGWQRMMSDAKLKKFEVLLVYTIDRMGRDRYALAVAKKALRDCGVSIIPIKQPIIEGPESIILDSLMEGLAEYYNADLARKVDRGMSDNARKCLANGSKPPLGYAVDPATKTYIINESGAEIVRFIFQAYLDGMQIKEIVAECKNRCYKNSNGKPIDNNVISRMLRNIKYTGVYKWKDIEVPDGMPRIISDYTYHQTQLKLAQKAHTNAHGKAKREYLLSDKVFCGNCGEAWVGESGYSATGAFYTYYKCRKAKVRKCKYKAISQEKLENQVYEMLMFKLFPNEEAIRAYVDFYVEKKSNDSYEQKQIAQYEKQLKSVQKKIDNIMMAVMQGIGIETAKDYIAPLEEDKKQLNKLIDQAKNSVKILDKERLFNIINSWLDIASLIAMSKQLEPDSDSYDTDDKRAKLYYRHMRAVLKSPILQKVYIYYGDDGNPDPKVKIGIDISKGSESSENDSVPSALNENITNSFVLESDRVTKTPQFSAEFFCFDNLKSLQKSHFVSEDFFIYDRISFNFFVRFSVSVKSDE